MTTYETIAEAMLNSAEHAAQYVRQKAFAEYMAVVREQQRALRDKLRAMTPQVEAAE